MIYYKAVKKSESGHSYLSYTHFYLPTKYVVKYKVGEFVSAPRGTKLFVFDTMENLMDFIQISHCIRVFSCEVTNPQPLSDSILRFDNLQDVQQYWTYKQNHYEYVSPKRGTVLADSVKLLQEIKI